MKTPYAWIAVVVLGCGVTVIAQPAADRKADDAAVAKLTANYESAYNSHDAKAAASFYATDGDRRTADGRVVGGRAAVERQLADDFGGRFKAAVVKFDAASEVRYVSATMAIVDGSAQLSGVISAGGQPIPPARYLHTLVAVKRGGAWQILALRNWPAPVPGK